MSKKGKQESTKQLYAIHYVKRNPATLALEVTDDGEPIAGELIKKQRQSPDVATEFNAHWEGTGRIMLLTDEDEVATPAPEGPNLKEKFPEVYAMKKADVVNNLESLDQPTEGTVDEVKKRLAEYLESQEE